MKDDAAAGQVRALVGHATAGRIAEVEEAVRGGASPDTADEDERTLLMHAALADRLELARWLLTQGADARRLDRWGLHALHLAAWKASPALVALLLEVLPVDLPDRNGDMTAMFYADRAGPAAPRKLRLLASSGADVDHTLTNGVGLVHRAAYAGRTGICRWLVAKGAHPDRPNDDGETPLLLALREGMANAATFLLRAGADPLRKDAYGGTTLIAAARGGLTAIARLLVGAGVDASAVDARGRTALHHAVETRNTELVELLLRAGADPNHQDEDGASPLMVAADACSLPIARLLLAAGADRSLRDKEDLTARDISEYQLDPELSAALE